MGAEIDVDLLKGLIMRDPQLVEDVLDRIRREIDPPITLGIIGMTYLQDPLPQAIIKHLGASNLTAAFISALAAEGKEVESVDTRPNRMTIIQENSFDLHGLEIFAKEAGAFRCRIKVNGHIAGSGILVSYRFVLTAWHVVNKKNGWPASTPPRIEIITSDGKTLPARLSEPFSPCHAAEWDGETPTDEQLKGHDDFALLRLAQPAGFSLGFALLMDPAPVWHDGIRSLLVHFPQGEDVGVSDCTAFFGGASRRYKHTAQTDGGSSGGALFSNQFEFIGIHQRRVGNGRHFIPIGHIANTAESALAKQIASDRIPNYLWSLTGDINGELIIGRRNFFDALDRMLDTSQPGGERLRGVWMRRKRPQEDQSGLGFAFELLQAFLDRRQPEAHLVRVALRAQEPDLFGSIEAALDGITGASVARAGVRENETTDVATVADQAEGLVKRIEERFGADPVWIYFEGPLQELAESTMRQLEQFLVRVQRSSCIRFVLTRLESYRIPLRRFESLQSITLQSTPGVFYDYTGDFEREDVETTIRAASRDLGLGLDDIVVKNIANVVLAGVEATNNLYPTRKLGEVASRLREQLQQQVAAA
jgi:hypothetical protein